MDSSVPDEGFVLRLESEDLKTEITVENREDLHFARSLLDFFLRRTADPSERNAKGQVREGNRDIHPDLRVDDPEEMKRIRSAIEQSQTAMDHEELRGHLLEASEQFQEMMGESIPSDEFYSFTDSISQELSKIRDSLNELNDRVSDIEQNGIETDQNQAREELEKDQVQVLTPNGNDESYDTVEEALADNGGLNSEDQDGDDDDPDNSESYTLDKFRSLSTDERSQEIFALVKQYHPITRMEVGERLFGYEIVSGSVEYGEVGNNWPTERTDVAEKDGRTKLYQPKQQEEDEADDLEQNDTESGAEDSDDEDEVSDEILRESESTLATGEADNEDAEPDTVDADNGVSEEVDIPDTDSEDDEDVNTVEFPEFKETGYTSEEFEELSSTGHSEVVLRAMCRCEGQAVVDDICDDIFADEPAVVARDIVKRLLSAYWKNVILELPATDSDAEPVYEISDELDIEFSDNPEFAALSQLQTNKHGSSMYHCVECAQSFKRSKKAKKHRKKKGHVNWKMRAAPGIMKDWVLKTQEQNQTAGAIQ